MTMHRRGFFKGLVASARLSVAPMSRGEVAEIALAAVRADEAKRTAVAAREMAAWSARLPRAQSSTLSSPTSKAATLRAVVNAMAAMPDGSSGSSESVSVKSACTSYSVSAPRLRSSASVSPCNVASATSCAWCGCSEDIQSSMGSVAVPMVEAGGPSLASLGSPAALSTGGAA